MFVLAPLSVSLMEVEIPLFPAIAQLRSTAVGLAVMPEGQTAMPTA